MNATDHLALDDLRAAAEEFRRMAEATTPKRLDWRPLGTGPSILGIARHCATRTRLAYRAMRQHTGEPLPEDLDVLWNELAEIEAGLTTLDDCWRYSEEGLARVFALYDELGPEALDAQVVNPNTGTLLKLRTIVDIFIWHYHYHTGQAAYVQALYGDSAMH